MTLDLSWMRRWSSCVAFSVCERGGEVSNVTLGSPFNKPEGNNILKSENNETLNPVVEIEVTIVGCSSTTAIRKSSFLPL